MFTTNFVYGMTYCNYTNVLAINRYTGQSSFLRFFQDCKTISPPPTPTPTPTPNPTPTPVPTPTPTPGLTPTVKVIEVGFTGDRLIRQYAVAGQPYIDPDGTVPTWKRTNNPNFPVAYHKGVDPVLFAKFTISPAQSTSRPAQIRFRMGNKWSSSKNVDLLGSSVSTSQIVMPFSNLETGPFVKKSRYEFKWQISFDNGNNWADMPDSETDHDVHWLNSNPPDEVNFKPFKNANGVQYQGLFDKALKWSTG